VLRERYTPCKETSERAERVVDKVTIAISRDTATRLKTLGKYGDTMESIIKHILDEYEKGAMDRARVT